jgi:protein N-terminal methyltransferase
MDMPIDPPLDSHADAAIDPEHSLKYWNSVSSDVNGMLGGFPQTSRIDLIGSRNFLTKLRRRRQTAGSKQPLPLLARVADCGAGIGRITKGLLMDVAQRVDVVEPVKKFTDELVASLEGEGAEKEKERAKLGDVVNLGLQDWIPEPGAYDLIWNQWCLGHLTDAQLVTYLERCKDGLRKPSAEAGTESELDPSQNSWIVVKENLSSDPWGKDIYDDEDSSVTRSDEKFRLLFQKAGLKIVATELQKGFPKELYAVRMYALRPE